MPSADLSIYGGDGQRVVKRFGSLSGSLLTPSKTTVYLPGGFEITGSLSGGALQVDGQSLAVMDDLHIIDPQSKMCSHGPA